MIFKFMDIARTIQNASNSVLIADFASIKFVVNAVHQRSRIRVMENPWYLRQSVLLILNILVQTAGTMNSAIQTNQCVEQFSHQKEHKYQ